MAEVRSRGAAAVAENVSRLTGSSAQTNRWTVEFLPCCTRTIFNINNLEL